MNLSLARGFAHHLRVARQDDGRVGDGPWRRRCAHQAPRACSTRGPCALTASVLTPVGRSGRLTAAARRWRDPAGSGSVRPILPAPRAPPSRRRARLAPPPLRRVRNFTEKKQRRGRRLSTRNQDGERSSWFLGCLGPGALNDLRGSPGYRASLTRPVSAVGCEAGVDDCEPGSIPVSRPYFSSPADAPAGGSRAYETDALDAAGSAAPPPSG
jgi:hypothetical protein